MWSNGGPSRRKVSNASLHAPSSASPTGLAQNRPDNLERGISDFASGSTPFYTPGELFQNQPQTPFHHSSLSRVDEDPMTTVSGGSNAPLLARDFAQPNHPRKSLFGAFSKSPDRLEEKEEDVKEVRSESDGDSSFVILPGGVASTSQESLPRRIKATRAISEKRILPPASVHDAYVSRFTASHDPAPTQPPSPTALEDRPPIFRTASAPGVPVSSPSSNRLLPSALPENAVSLEEPTIGTAAECEEGKPIFEMFDANLSVTAEEMVKRLKRHLEDVLKAQEEIGRMHLSLEKLTVSAPGLWDEEAAQAIASPPRVARQSPGGASILKSPGRRRNSSSAGINSSPKSARRVSSDQQSSAVELGDEHEEALAKREQGVDEIMERVSKYSLVYIRYSPSVF